LAAIGLYGVLAYTVTLRTREIGLRMALGADSGKVREMVLWQVGRMMIIGGVLGVAAGLGLGKAAKSLLYGAEGTDPFVIGAVALLLTIVALGAGYIPALRASRVDPMGALRYE
jgi:ABC-type antimicrobial peptide transport system permease subunit